MTQRRHRDVDDDLVDEAPAIPDPDFADPRPAYADEAVLWGTPRPHDLEAVGQVLDGVLGRFAGTPASALEQVKAVWPNVSGDAWSTARPVQIQGTVLVMEVPNGTVASRLQFEEGRLLEVLRGVAGGSIERVRFRVARSRPEATGKTP